MFDRFIRLARARKALENGRFEDAIELADDPLIRGDRRAEELRQQARSALCARAEERLRHRDHGAAVRDLDRAVAAGADAQVAQRLAEARQLVAADQRLAQAGQRAVDEARRLAEQGRLAAAEAAAKAAAGVPQLAPTLQTLAAFVAARRERAGVHLEAARSCLRERRLQAAIDEFRSARAMDDAVAAAPLLGELLAAAADDVRGAVARQLAAGEVQAAHAHYRDLLAQLPELAAAGPVVAAGEDLAAALLARLRAADRPECDLALLHAALAEPALPGAGPRLRAAALALQRLPALRGGGRAVELADALAEAGQQLGTASLLAECEQARAQGAVAEERLAKARALVAAGELSQARAELLTVLEVWPMHEQARGEVDAIDQGLRERERRLQAAREAAKAGRLREAYALALAQAVPGPAGDEARLLAKEWRARMDLVARGLDQVRAALHGRDSNASEGLRHCLLRLDELAKVQCDQEEMPALRAALLAELAGVERCEAALAALARRDFRDAATGLCELVDGRGRLLAPERLDARLLVLADRIGLCAEEALAGGRLLELEQCTTGLAAASAVRADFGNSVARLRAAAAARRQRAEELVAEARELLVRKQLTAAEDRCEAARQLWVDGSGARRLEDELRAVREQEAALVRVAALAADGDLAGARAQLGDMAPTPAPLRTRVFDMKQSLAKAQGFDGGFLLRVDEGGEFLVLRGESIVIGNVRDGRADLPILAAIAGRHARIQRSMSFHGGMQDAIVADGGELRIGGSRLTSHRLRSGDRIGLGPTLQLHYTVPSTRSLAAALQLLGGFQVAGTDRVLLLKDRGRDGRILIGPGKDVHVAVPGAKGEVEVFAHKTGQIRVQCDGGGLIDGKPFKGEHPVPAGAMVSAAGVTFVLLPWSKPR